MLSAAGKGWGYSWTGKLLTFAFTNLTDFCCRLMVAPLVNGRSGAVHKSFDRKSDAYLWLQAALLKGTVELINELSPPRTSVTTLPPCSL